MDTPIACSLTAAQYRDRTADLAQLAERHLLAREPIAGGARLTLARSEAVEREIEAANAAEAACCPFLGFALQRHDERLVLDVTGPADAQPIIAELFEAPRPRGHGVLAEFAPRDAGSMPSAGTAR
jgi:hypothetical protein